MQQRGEGCVLILLQRGARIAVAILRAFECARERICDFEVYYYA